MCTLILDYAPGTTWPVLIAANRDEMLSRPWDPPAEYWPGIVGGRDTLAGGTWLGLNRHGVMAGVLNRAGSLGPAAGKRSRGELPLLALAAASARQAAEAIAALDAAAWRGFNMVIADPGGAFFVRGVGVDAPTVIVLDAGVHMVTAADPNDMAHPRVRRHLPAFRAAPRPSPPDWRDWPRLLADGAGPWDAALNVPERAGFGTASAALIALAPGSRQFAFCPRRPGAAPFAPVPLPL